MCISSQSRRSGAITSVLIGRRASHRRRRLQVRSCTARWGAHHENQYCARMVPTARRPVRRASRADPAALCLPTGQPAVRPFHKTYSFPAMRDGRRTVLLFARSMCVLVANCSSLKIQPSSAQCRRSRCSGTLPAHLQERASAMEKAKPEGKIRNHDGPVGGRNTGNACVSGAHGGAAGRHAPAGDAR